MLAVMSALDRFLRHPYPRLPRPLDWASERWSAMRPRARIVAAGALVILGFVAVDSRVGASLGRWGGPPTEVLVATSDLPTGAALEGLERRKLPQPAVPDGAVTAPPEGARLSFALPAGAILTRYHLDKHGAAAGLPPDLRAVPIPAQEGWGVVAGGWVDVWVLGQTEGGSQLVARSRPVLEVRSDDSGSTALVGLSEAEVGLTTSGLSLGGVLLAHAPPPN
jgi:hypothetical protein